PSGRSIQKSYENGNDEYFHDLYSRFSHMEQLHADSIQFNDSLKYQTKSGRTVYGGGGIMPDIFVPADTTGNSPYFDQIYRKGLIYTFAYNYADSNREKLSQFQTGEEFDQYLNQQNVLNEFVNFAQEKGVKRDAKGLQQSKEIIQTQLKAYIARNIIGEEGFYPIIRQIDNTLQKAIEISQENLLVENLTND